MMCRAVLFAAFAAVATANSMSASTGGSTVGRLIANPMDGFTDVSGSKFQNFPDFMVGADALVVDRDTFADFFVEFECDSDYCDMYFMTYRCHPCESKNIGTLHATLILEGWISNGCGPTFSFKPGGFQHRFTVYHKEVERGFHEFYPKVEADFVWAAIKSKTALCSTYAYDKTKCNARPECSYNNELGACQTFWCPKPVHQGPSTGCAICAKNTYGLPNMDDIYRS